jgi:alpha-ketoglutarate-dependent taurine dioxygenase
MQEAGPLPVRALPGAFGAVEVLGLDVPERCADPRARAELREALWAHGVLCIRFAAPLDDDTARAVASMIGPIKDPIGRTRDGGEMRYSEDRQIIDAGFVLTDELRAELGDLKFGGDSLRPGLFETFHTDDAYTERPAAATVLHARELPSTPGGETQFIDMRAAFRQLEPEMRQRLIGLSAMHAYNNRGAFPPRVAAEGPFDALVDVTYPLVRAHPVTGSPALYFDLDRATHIDGMDEAEGRALLQSLQDRAERDAPRYAHTWKDHDVLMWDNASVQHKASGNFAVGEPRKFWRYMIEGTRPIAAPASAAAIAAT